MDKDNLQKLIYGLSHDMGAPLRSAVQFSSLLTKRLESKLDDKEKYWLQLIQENGLKAQTMLEALLSFSRLTTHQNTFRQFQLDDVIQQALISKKHIIDEKQAEITYVANQLALYGDKEQWTFLFQEIIANALLFQPSNHSPKLIIEATPLKTAIIITCEDNGIGVKEQHYAQLCLPFKRLNGEAEYPGLGMGLSYCKQIVTLHNGHIQFEQSQFGGLKVIIHVPLTHTKDA
jgi:light-regulated signal transduction histidine kinase (bacteriophytochrome)